MSEPQFVTLSFAMAHFEALDQAKFLATVKRHRCYVKKGGIVRVNITELQTRLDEDFAKAQEKALNRKVGKGGIGTKVGLISARLSQVKKRLAAKQAKIELAQKAVADADDRLSKHRAAGTVSKLLAERQMILDGQARDLKLLDELMNSLDKSIDESTSDSASN